MQIRREYALRFSALFSIFVFFALCAGIVASFPFVLPIASDYFFARRESKEAESFEVSEADQEILTELQDFKTLLAVLNPKNTDGGTILSQLIALIVAEKPSQIALQSFLLIPESDTKKRLQISGKAATRESLVAFSRRLESSGAFLSVDLPISNLSRKVDIEFSIIAVVGKEDVKKGSQEAAEDKADN